MKMCVLKLKLFCTLTVITVISQAMTSKLLYKYELKFTKPL